MNVVESSSHLISHHCLFCPAALPGSPQIVQIVNAFIISYLSHSNKLSIWFGKGRLYLVKIPPLPPPGHPLLLLSRIYVDIVGAEMSCPAQIVSLSCDRSSVLSLCPVLLLDLLVVSISCEMFIDLECCLNSHCQCIVSSPCCPAPSPC